jgi:hypothetical protein
MIVWGGRGSASNTPGTGATYDPVTDTWAPVTTTGAPISRSGHSAVWARSRMVVWGGGDPNLPYFYDTGGLYDPGTDTWVATPTPNAPNGRTGHTAVWSGSRMIVWGGANLPSMDFYLTGGTYDDPGLLGPPTDFYTVSPCRVVDTRHPVSPSGGPIRRNTTRRFLTAACGILHRDRVSVNLTAVGPSPPATSPSTRATPPARRSRPTSASPLARPGRTTRSCPWRRTAPARSG